MLSGITTYPRLSPLRRLPHSAGTPPHHHTHTVARAYRRRRRWCRSSCRSASPRASSSVAKAKSGLTPMKSARSPWPTPVRLILFPTLINCSLGWGRMDLWMRYLPASFGIVRLDGICSTFAVIFGILVWVCRLTLWAWSKVDS